MNNTSPAHYAPDTYTFGFDIGTNSIGWAAVDPERGNIQDGGVLVIPSCTETENDTPKNQTRREKRQARRQLMRRGYRKSAMRQLLRQHGMFPKVEEDALQAMKLAPELQIFFSPNPYTLRQRAAEGQPLSLMELGRVCYQLAHRRGFPTKEISSTASSDKKQQEASERTAFSITEEGIKQGNHPTLGHYLASLDSSQTTIRNRHLLRFQYEEEFHYLWEQQAKHHPYHLTPALKDAIATILFFQRPLRDQSHLIGYCTFEPRHPRAPQSSPYFERFRVHQFVNNLKINGQPLDETQRQTLIKKVSGRKTALPLEMHYKKEPHLLEALNYPPNTEVPLMPANTALEALFGKATWKKLTLEAQQQRWHYLYHATNKEELLNHATKKWGLEDEATLLATKKRLGTKLGHLSHKALQAMLPYLEAGYGYTLAAPLGSLPFLFGTQRWQASPRQKRIRS